MSESLKLYNAVINSVRKKFKDDPNIANSYTIFTKFNKPYIFLRFRAVRILNGGFFFKI